MFIMATMTYLIIILAISSVTSFPLGYYDPSDWDYIYPQLNVSLVNYCFFNKSDWQSIPASENAMWCNLLIGPPEDLDLFPDQLVRPLTDRYKQHVINEITDQEAVLECFANNRYYDKVHHCQFIELSNLMDNTMAQRRAQISDYFDLLSRISSELEVCWDFIASPMDFPYPHAQDERCNRAAINVVTLVEHCSKYHPSKQAPSFGPCEKLKYSLNKPHSSIRSIAYFIEWTNKTAQNKLENLPFTDVHPEVVPYRHVMNTCFNSDEWLGDPSHRCHIITAPLPDVEYCPLDRLMQSEWKRVTAELASDDCTFYHKKQFKKYKGICSKPSN